MFMSDTFVRVVKSPLLYRALQAAEMLFYFFAVAAVIFIVWDIDSSKHLKALPVSAVSLAIGAVLITIHNHAARLAIRKYLASGISRLRPLAINDDGLASAVSLVSAVVSLLMFVVFASLRFFGVV